MVVTARTDGSGPTGPGGDTGPTPTGPPTPSGPRRAGVLTYLWRHRWGRFFLLLTAVGVVGLTGRYWTAAPLLAALTPERLGLRRAS